MEKESFEDGEVAEILNRKFVAIKVDREERPDVDHIYMNVCQMLTGQGGWPLTIVMTPDKKPFFAGTYFSKVSQWGRPGMLELLPFIVEHWENHQCDILNYCEEVMQLINESRKSETSLPLTEDVLDRGYKELEAAYDRQLGGFGAAPKFPTPHNLMFLLRYWRRTGTKQALVMVEHTLTMMRQGGIYDHLGYGFARYSTDEKWLVPHFEKMLYDNALLCCAYLEAFQCTGNQDFARVAEEILTYVLRDMTDDEGGFYSAEDADSEGVEGKFYVFTHQEILGALGQEQGTLFADFYGATVKGNFEQGANILYYTGRQAAEFAAKRGIRQEDLESILATGRTKLYQLRSLRIRPHKDDKILTAWNALMIVAFAKAARVLNRAEYAVVAERALEFIYERLLSPDGRLLARYRDDEAAHPAYLDDYAFLLWALLEMYETVFSPVYIKNAVQLAEEMKRLFWDEKQGGFFFYGVDSEALIAKPKELYDGAIPSGNSVAAYALEKLARLTGTENTVQWSAEQREAFAGEVARHPRAYTFFLVAVEYALAPQRQIVISGHPDAADTWTMLGAVGGRFLPGFEFLFNDISRPEAIEEILPHIAGQNVVNNQATAYVCDSFACQAPINGTEQFLAKLQTIDNHYQ